MHGACRAPRPLGRTGVGQRGVPAPALAPRMTALLRPAPPPPPFGGVRCGLYACAAPASAQHDAPHRPGRAGPRAGQLTRCAAASSSMPLDGGSEPLPPASTNSEDFSGRAADVEWLRRFVPFTTLEPGLLHELLTLSSTVSVPPGQRIVEARKPPDELVIIREGVALKARPSSNGSGSDTDDGMSVAPGSNTSGVVLGGEQLGAGSVLNWRSLLLGGAPRNNVTAASRVKLWTVPAAAFRDLAARRPALMAALGMALGVAVDTLEDQVQRAEERSRALAPFLVTAPKRGIVGHSPYAERLRKTVVAAAKTPKKHVLVFGEPGLQKSNIAALVHYGGPSRAQRMVQLDCSAMDPAGSELFGRGDKPGLLAWLGEGTLLLRNVHKLPLALVPQVAALLKDGTYRPTVPSLRSGTGAFVPLKSAPGVRIVLTASQAVPALASLVLTVKVPPLRVRPADVKDLTRYFLTRFARTAGGPVPTLSADALRRLEAYTWPGNITELATVVERAAIQAAGEAPAAGSATISVMGSMDGGPGAGKRLSADVFWFAQQPKDRYRLNLLATFPPLRQLLRSELWPDAINFKFTAWVYPLVVALLLWGPQDREHNAALTVFWDVWWPVIFLVYPFLGRIWCAFCPFMIYGELVQKLRLATGATLLKWPREAMDKYGGVLLFALFAGILVWEEVWDLPNTAALSGWLLIIITAGAMVCSAIFERRLWCRYLCPIGGMNGLFAKLSFTELRARHGVCSGECSTYHCYKGGPAQPPNGLESPGCPLYSHPAQLVDNANCVLCMECLKACPHSSVELRVRPAGADLWGGHTASYHELVVLFILLGAVYVHHIPGILGQFGLEPYLLEGVTAPHLVASWTLLLLPGALALGADALQRRLNAEERRRQPAPFLEMAYAYLPLVFCGTLAHYLPYLLLEAGGVLKVTAAMVGWEDAPLPVFAAHPAVVAFLQGCLLLLGGGSAAALVRKLGAAPWPSVAPSAALVAALSAELWALIMPP